MAEVAGLVLGVAAVPALFKTCVDFLDVIALERNYGKDFEVSIAKVSILKSRLHGCGESLSSMPASHDPSDPSCLQRKPQGEAIQKSLLGLQACFSDEQKLKNSYGLKPVAENMSMVASSSPTAVSPRLAEVQSSFNLTIRTRQKGTPLGKKIWWVVHDKKKFDELVFDALFYIESIEAICAQLKVLRTEDEIVKAAVDRVTTREGIQLLQQAVDEMPSRLAAKAKIDNDQGLAESTGHIHIRAAVSERARFIMGNVGVKSDARHYSRDGNFSGDSVVIGGDMSADALEILLRR
jgi:hypothetical protein